MKAGRASGHTCAGIAALALAAVAGWTAWGAPALVPAPRQMKLTGGEYVAKTYMEVKRRPRYLVSDRLEPENNPDGDSK